MTNFYRLRTHHFRLFLALCEHKSLTRTAEALNTVQPALSRALREMEAEVGAQLFDRTSTGMVPTAAGETLQRFVSTGVAQIEQGLQWARGSRGIKKVAVGILPNVARTIMPETVARFKKLSPDVSVRLYRDGLADLLAMMRAGEIDFIASRMFDVEEAHGLTFEYLYSEPLIFVADASHPLAGRDSLSPDDVNNYSVIIPLPGTLIRKELDRFLFSLGFPGFRMIIETISLDFTRSYLQRGEAVACVPMGTVETELQSRQLVRIRIRADEIKGSVGLSFQSRRDLSIEARRLVRILREVASERQADAARWVPDRPS